MCAFFLLIGLKTTNNNLTVCIKITVTLQIRDESFLFKNDTRDLLQLSISNGLVKIAVFLNPTRMETLCRKSGRLLRLKTLMRDLVKTANSTANSGYTDY